MYTNYSYNIPLSVMFCTLYHLREYSLMHRSCTAIHFNEDNEQSNKGKIQSRIKSRNHADVLMIVQHIRKNISNTFNYQTQHIIA